MRPDDVEDEEAQEDAERDEAEDRADISDELRQGGPSYLSGLLAVEYGNIGRDQRPTIGRALQTETSIERSDPVGEPDEPRSCRLGPSDAVITDFDAEPGNTPLRHMWPPQDVQPVTPRWRPEDLEKRAPFRSREKALDHPDGLNPPTEKESLTALSSYSTGSRSKSHP